MKYLIEVDRENCISCGVCYTTDPDHFKADNEGKSTVLNGTTNGVSKGTFDDTVIESVKLTASKCPASVITVS